MDDAAARKPRGILLRFGDIVAMRQENVRDASQFFEPIDQMREILRGVDEPVALGTRDEIAISSEGFRRIEAAVVYAAFERHRKIGFRLAGGDGIERADRTGWASKQRTGCASRGF